MKTSLTLAGKKSLRRLSPPPRRAQTVKTAAPRSTDIVALSKKAKPTDVRSLSKPLLAALTGLTVLTAFAGPAAAQTPPGTAPLLQANIEHVMETPVGAHDGTLVAGDLRIEPPADLRLEPFEISSDTTKVKKAEADWGVQINSVNDFMPDSWTSWLGGPDHKIPDGSAFDDDGWTAEVQLITNFQKGDEELVVGGRLMMVTQPGSRAPFGADYQGLRTDVGEFVVQKNFREQLNDQLTLDYGVGGGVQAIGNIGGEKLQRWWHESGPVGGRVGDALQGNQMTDGFRVMPMLTGGARLNYNWNDAVDLRLTGQANVPVGNGMGYAGLRAGVGKEIGPFNLEVGGKLDGVWTGAEELSFHDPSGLREGLYGRLEYEPGKWGGVYTQLETGGLRNEPILTLGVRIGFGTKARLNPFQ